MRSLHVLRRHLGNERGIGMFATAIWMTAFFALTAVGVDVARIAFTATEVQTAAEVAATAGATALLNGGTPQTDADFVVGKNTVNAHAAAPAVLKIGNVNTSGAFREGVAPLNAVMATSMGTVDNLFSGVIGSAKTTVTKTAVATFTAISSDTPTLPIALDANCFDVADCAADTTKCPTVSTHDNSACWTGYTAGSNDSTINSYLPAGGSCGGGGVSPGIVNVGTSIQLTNGGLSGVYNHLQCQWCADKTKEFIVPVVTIGRCPGGSGACTQSLPVTGFASVTIKDFLNNGGNSIGCGGTPHGIVLKTLRNVEAPGGVGGCVKCGTGFIRLVG